MADQETPKPGAVTLPAYAVQGLRELLARGDDKSLPSDERSEVRAALCGYLRMALNRAEGEGDR